MQDHPAPRPELLTIDEVAAVCRLSRRFVTQAVSDGALEVIRFGRAVRIKPDAVETWIETRSSGGTDRA